jgi:hypothetical protein
MTFRDANADAMIDYFDFSRCHTAGLNPPLPTTRYDGASDVSRYLHSAR